MVNPANDLLPTSAIASRTTQHAKHIANGTSCLKMCASVGASSNALSTGTMQLCAEHGSNVTLINEESTISAIVRPLANFSLPVSGTGCAIY